MDADTLNVAAEVLAELWRNSPWQPRVLAQTARAKLKVKRTPKWLQKLVDEMLAAFPEPPKKKSLAKWLSESPTLSQAAKRSRNFGALLGQDIKPRYSTFTLASTVASQLANNAWSPSDVELQLGQLARSNRVLCGKISQALITEFGLARPSRQRLCDFLRSSRDFRSLVGKSTSLQRLRLSALTPVMQAAPGRPTDWRVPEIVTPAGLAAWLGIPAEVMWWLAKANAGEIEHYQRRWFRKRSGGWRLLEAPKSRLKQVQRDIAGGILNRIPPHEAVHGFRCGRNIRTYVQAHTGQEWAMRMDLRDFFPSVQRRQVEAIFRTAGYPSAVSELLARLTTTATPVGQLQEFSRSRGDEARGPRLLNDLETYRVAHLPQGAPSSPALANLAAYRLDCRLAGLAGRHRANYTRYADDFLFSGGRHLRRDFDKLHVFVLSVILEEGFQINPRKTRVMPKSSRQQAAGLVFNSQPNTPRRDYDQLKAILHNCRHQGSESQNHADHPHFESHLLGRVHFHRQINPKRGEKLLRMYREAFPRVSDIS